MVAHAASSPLPLLGRIVAVDDDSTAEPSFLRVFPREPREGDAVVCREVTGRLVVVRWGKETRGALVLGVVVGKIAEG